VLATAASWNESFDQKKTFSFFYKVYIRSITKRREARA
jgi:hypothetical protein